MINLQVFQQKNKSGQKISMITCYDYLSACILDKSDIDAVLVGDSLAMVMHGHETTIPATVDMMTLHVAAVNRGIKSKPLVADMPFLAHRKGLTLTMETVDRFCKSGAQAVKIEGAGDALTDIEYIIRSGVPVMGHLGMTPQSVHQLGGHRLQGKGQKTATQLIENAKMLEQAGVFSIVLEMVPSSVGKKITKEISVPTIGIGAGVNTSGQILVWHDLLGMNPSFKPKFLRTYLDAHYKILEALNGYCDDVKNKNFPSKQESY